MAMAGCAWESAWEARDRTDYAHSRKGIIATRVLSLGSPFHFGMMIAFSGCEEACSGWQSSKMTFERSRFRYFRSYRCNRERLEAATRSSRSDLDGLTPHRARRVSE